MLAGEETSLGAHVRDRYGLPAAVEVASVRGESGAPSRRHGRHRSHEQARCAPAHARLVGQRLHDNRSGHIDEPFAHRLRGSLQLLQVVARIVPEKVGMFEPNVPLLENLLNCLTAAHRAVFSSVIGLIKTIGTLWERALEYDALGLDAQIVRDGAGDELHTYLAFVAQLEHACQHKMLHEFGTMDLAIGVMRMRDMVDKAIAGRMAKLQEKANGVLSAPYSKAKDLPPLKEIIGGAPRGACWSDGLDKKCTYKGMRKVVKNTLMKYTPQHVCERGRQLREGGGRGWV